MVNQKEINVRSHDPCGVRIRRKKQVANLVRNNDAQQIADRQALPHRHVCDGFDQHWGHRATGRCEAKVTGGSAWICRAAEEAQVNQRSE